MFQRGFRFVNFIRLAILSAVLICSGKANAQSTAFNYQGRLQDGGTNATGNYDFQFTLWDSLTGGTQQPPPAPETRILSNVPVTNGVFTVQLDFGSLVWPGTDRFLEVSVRPFGYGGPYTILSPRQPITPTPYSIHTLFATSADNLSTVCVNCVQDSQIKAVTGSKVTGAIPVAAVPAGSGNYIQNSTSQQASSNFNISGTGVVGSALGIGTSTPSFKLDVIDPFSAGLRVLSNSLGGEVAEFGAKGDFRIDATSSEARFLVRENGNVGVGTSGPNTKLDIAGNVFVRGSGTLANNPGAAELQIGYGLAPFGTSGSVSRLALQPYGHTGGPWKFIARDDATHAYLDWVYGSATTGITQDGSGKVGIGTGVPDATLSVNGTADKPGGGSWGTFSDERLKNIRGRFTPGLNAVMRLQPLRYEYKQDNALGIKSEGEHIGFSAQQVQQIIPEAVSKNDKGFLLVNNDPILWTMLNAIKEQQAQIDKQQKQIDQLKKVACHSHAKARVCR